MKLYDDIERRAMREIMHTIILLTELDPHDYRDMRWIRLVYNENFTSDILMDYPHYPWYWPGASKYVTVQMVRAHPKWPVCWDIVSRNVSVHDVVNSLDLPWRWDILSQSKNIRVTEMMKHLDLPWSWAHASANPSVSVSFMLDHPELPWCWSQASYNETLTVHDVIQHQNLPWNWDRLSYNLNVDDMIAHAYLPWNWIFVCERASFEQTMNIPATPNWYNVSRNVKSYKTVLAHPTLPWNWSALMRNDNISFDEILELSSRLGKQLHVHDVITYRRITMAQVNANAQFPWDYVWLGMNEGITMQDVARHPDRPWSFKTLSHNPNLDFCFVVNHIFRGWNYDEFVSNPFRHERALFIEREIHRHLAAFRIQVYWRKASTDPTKYICQKIQYNKVNKSI